MTLRELADKIGAEVVGDPNIEITAANTLEDAVPGEISFLSNPRYTKQMETTHASAVIVAPRVRSDRVTLLKTKNPHYSFTQAVVLLHGYRTHMHQGIHPKAHVEPSAKIGQGTIIYPGVYVGANVKIGKNCVLHPNVVVYNDCVIGDNVTIHSNCSIGQDGFGYATVQGMHHKIPQVGNVIIEDDVEIGANCAIDRAAMGSTVIGKGTKFSNLVSIGHGTKIGEHGLVVGLVGIAGSSTLGHHVTLGGQVGIAGHIRIGDNVTVGAQSGITNNIPDQTTVLGFPAMPIGQARRALTLYTQLPQLRDRIKHLEQQVAELAMEEGGDLDQE